MKLTMKPPTHSHSGNTNVSHSLVLTLLLSTSSLFVQPVAAQQAPTAPTRLEVSAVTSPRTSAYDKLTYEIIGAPNHTYGYDVFADGRLIFHQTYVPALPGDEGFKTREDATKVALLVIDKIKKGKTPPTISIGEMKILSVIK